MTMEFDLNSCEKIVHHWMLQSKDQIEEISKTSEWKEGGKFVARVTVNGVELPFESLENYLQEVYKMTEEEAKRRFADLDAEVERRITKRLTEEAQPILDKMNELQNALEDAGNLLRPYWDKKTEIVAWHRDQDFSFHFSLGAEKPQSATANPQEWTPLYSE